MRRRKLLQVMVMVVLAVTLCQNLCFAGLIKVGGSSMEPTIKNGQKLWVSNYSERTHPERGDIIAFKVENSVNIKRVIGLPKEKVIIQKGYVFIANQSNPQGERLIEPYLSPETFTEPEGEFIVPDSQYFVLGDNRGHSQDSRQIGCILRKNIIGKVTKIF